MPRRPILVVVIALLAALAVLALVGRRVLERDRRAMYDRFAEERMQGIEEAGHSLTSDIGDIGEDLDLASALLQNAESTRVAERELHAIATIKREYLVMDVRADDRSTTRVVALDAPKGVAALADVALVEMLDAADADPGTTHCSGALGGERDLGAWYRVFARRPATHGPSVAVVVDMSIVLGRLKLQRDPSTKLLVMGPNGFAAPLSDRSLATLAGSRPALLGSALQAAHDNRSTISTVEPELAESIGLPQTTAVLVAVPVQVVSGPPWTLLVVVSTVALQTQEQTLVRRVLVGGGLVLLLLLSAAAYVVLSTRRAATLRERLRHVDRLAHLTEKAEKIIDHIPSGVLTLSEARRVTGVNRWFAGRLTRNITGNTLAEAFDHAPAEDLATLSDLVERAVASHTPQSLPRARLRLLGQEALISIHAIPLERSVADVSLLVVFDDLTQLRRIEERLLHSEKLVTAGQLAAGIAHEIGTPLNVARGRVELSLGHLGETHAEAPNHKVALDQIDRVTRLIQQLLDYVRPTTSAMQDVNAAQTLQVVQDLLTAHATKHNVTLRVECSTSLPALRADPDQVQQVLVNLVLNAIDACERGGHVTLGASPRAGAVQLEVTDDGQGIPHEIQAQIFDPFFTTKKRGQGTGLGLWVVAQLVRSHAAEIELVSAPGSGTKVRVTWPVAA
jgi:signal transduction histidine kinase